jgi:hypothetical protein
MNYHDSSQFAFAGGLIEFVALEVLCSSVTRMIFSPVLLKLQLCGRQHPCLEINQDPKHH